MRCLSFLFMSALCCAAQADYRDWQSAGGSADNIHYSSLSQINRENVQSLRVAWTFESGDSYPGSDMQCNPIIVDGVMFVTTPKLRIVALSAATGKERWSFTGQFGGRAPHPNRGLTYWTDGKDSRILLTLGHELLSLNAKTGKLDRTSARKVESICEQPSIRRLRIPHLVSQAPA